MRTAHALFLISSLGLAPGCSYYQRHAYNTAPTPVIVSSTPQVAVWPAPQDSDTPLAKRVRRELRNNPKVAAAAANVDVKDEDGIVTLTGVVPSNDDKNLIENLVSRAPGVVIVNDDLVVALTPTGRVAPLTGSLHVEDLSATDRLLAERILEVLKTDTILPPLLPTVDIKVTNGRVLLQGIVQSMQQKQAIVSDVQRAAGVENVIDQLQVQSAP